MTHRYLYRYPDGSFKLTAPQRVEFEGGIRRFADLTAEQLDSIGYNEAETIERDQFTTYETQWVKGEDSIYREEVVTATVDEVAKFDAAYRAKQREITDKADAFIRAAEMEYGIMERQTWEQQASEAVAFRSDPDAAVPLLDAIAVYRGMALESLAERVVRNRAAWLLLSGAVVGQRLAYQDALERTVTSAEVESIEVFYMEPA